MDAKEDTQEVEEPAVESAILSALDKIENKALLDYIEENDIRAQMQTLMNGFFDKKRAFLPENPYPEITKRFRQIEENIRWQRSLDVVNSAIDSNLQLFHLSTSTVTKLVPVKLFNKIILSSSKIKEKEVDKPPPNPMHSTLGLNLNESDDDVHPNDDTDSDDEDDDDNDDGNGSEQKSIPKPEATIKVFGFEHVISGISDVYWIECICKELEHIISPVEMTLDQCNINKISLISSPIFFADSYDFLDSLSREHVLFAHLFPRSRKMNGGRSWPYFMANGRIDIYHHVGITAATFQKAVSTFSKFIQQQIYWISVSSKKAANYRFFFQKLMVNEKNPHFWTFDEIKRNRKKFETNIKHAVAQKHSIRMTFYFVGPDEALLFECRVIWYFYFRDVKTVKAMNASRKNTNNDLKAYDIEKVQKALDDLNQRKPEWTSFSLKPYYSVYHGIFVNYGDIELFSAFFKHLQSEITENTFGNSFAEWQLTDWSQIIKGLDEMQYGSVIAYLYRLASLVDSTTFDKTQKRFQSKEEEKEAIKTVQTFREKVLSEMRITIYGQGILIQGFMNCVSRIISILEIFDREQAEISKRQSQETKQSAHMPSYRRSKSLQQQIEEMDHRMAGEWIHKALSAMLLRFDEISDFHYPLYSEYLHCIPRIRFVLTECVHLIPSWTDLVKLSVDPRSTLDRYLSELQQIFQLIGNTLIRDHLSLCASTRLWIKQRRDHLKSPPPKLDYIPSNKVMKMGEAIDHNLKTFQIPKSIPLQGTFLQYAIDTEMDRWFVKSLFTILSDPQVFNPFIKIVIEAQQMSFKFDSYKQSDDEIAAKIINLEEIRLVVDDPEFRLDEEHGIRMSDLQDLYQFNGIFGYKSALSFINATALRNIHKDLSLHIPVKLMTNDSKSNNEKEENTADSKVFLSLCGEVGHYPYFDIQFDDIQLIQNVFISGSRFEEIVEIFAIHCWNLSQFLFKKSSSVTFISLSIGQSTYQCDMIIKKSNCQFIQTLLVQAAKTRQAISMKLMVSSSILKQYLSVQLDIFLIYHEITTNRYRLCWPFRADIIFTALFFEIEDAIKFWRAYSVGDLSSSYNLEHKDYRRELLGELQLNEDNAEYDRYFHSALRYKALNQDTNGVIEIYRFFDEITLCGKCIESLQQLLLVQRILNYRKSSRFLKSQMNRQIVSRQMKESVTYSKRIIFSNLLTFFDRTMMLYLQRYYDLYNAIDDEIYPALNAMIKLFIPVKHACTRAWTSWLIERNKNMLIHKP